MSQQCQVTESHQSTKADTSGTAKASYSLYLSLLFIAHNFIAVVRYFVPQAIVGHLSKLTGSDFSFESIVKIRDTESQVSREPQIEISSV